MAELEYISASDEDAAQQKAAEKERLKTFMSQWELEEIPACGEGMIFLMRFADAHPGPYEIARRNNFGAQVHPMFDQLKLWHAFATHMTSCPKCNEYGQNESVYPDLKERLARNRKTEDV
jgi:hypothetical protein